jgi:Kef-type K+ transport system membrane component KefB
VVALIGVVVSVGFADSINPSTVGPALYIATYRDGGRRLLGFIAGVFAVSTTAGIVLLLGPGRLLLSHHPTPHTEHLAELVGGLCLLVAGIALWVLRGRVVAHVVEEERRVRRSTILVGAGIMAVELPTALPYFAVLAAIAGSSRGRPTQISLVLLFNVVFVAPLLVILLVRSIAGQPGLDWLERQRQRLERRAGEAVAVLVLVIAVVLIAVGAVGLAGG